MFRDFGESLQNEDKVATGMAHFGITSSQGGVRYLVLWIHHVGGEHPLLMKGSLVRKPP